MIIKIKVKTNSRTDSIDLGLEEIDFEVKIKASPIDGKANAYLIKFLAKKLEINVNSIFLKSGLSAKLKYFVVENQGAVEKLKEALK